MSKFGGGGSWFNPGFSKREEIRMMEVYKSRYGSRVKWMKDGSDVKTAQSEMTGTWIKFNITTKKKKGE